MRRRQEEAVPAVDSARQRQHYVEHHDQYSSHYYDRHSMAYRDRFLNSPMFAEMDLSRKRVAELMAGSGPLAAYVQKVAGSAKIEGFDISPAACRDFVASTGHEAHALDLTKEPLPESRFDVVAIAGGLHHVAHFLPFVMENIHRSLKPRGYLVMMEPNKDHLLDFVRRFWYQMDRYFDDENEEALSYPELKRDFSHLFEERSVVFMGGPAYYLVLQSMILRAPHFLKALYAGPLAAVEGQWNRLPWPSVKAYFVAQWRKLP